MPRKRKTILSFYCDDTSPYGVGAKAFQTFLDYCAEQKIAGESSAILAGAATPWPASPNDEEQAFLKQVARAWDCGIGTHMEMMTHGGLFDFEANRKPEGAIHEGLWLHEPAVTREAVRALLRQHPRRGGPRRASSSPASPGRAAAARPARAGTPNCGPPATRSRTPPCGRRC